MTVTRPRGMSTAATMLFAVAGGAAVGNLYWAQPLLDTIGRTFGITAGQAGLLVTVTQIGYAVGVFFLVPLGDVVNRRRMIPSLMLAAAVALTGVALSPTYPALLAALSLLGVATVAGQLLAPLAGDLAREDQRGRVLATIAAGMMIGILIARAVSGVVTDLLGWRALYGLVAALMLVVALVMARWMPSMAPRPHIPYGTLLTSVLRTARTSARVRARVLIGASVMSVFTLFWTGLTFLLSADPHAFTTTGIGLISLVGVAGALAAQRAGRLFDRGFAVPAMGVGVAVALISIGVAAAGSASLAAIVVAIALFSIGVQSVQVLVQTSMLSLDPAARSRLNAVFVVGNFVGGAVGSALAGVLWEIGGWTLLMIAAAALTTTALAVWALQRTRALAD